MNSETLDMLLRASDRTNSNIDTAIMKLVNMAQLENNEELIGVIVNLMDAQSELVNMDRGLAQTLNPNVVSEIDNLVASTQAKQREILQQLRQQQPTSENEQSFIM